MYTIYTEILKSCKTTHQGVMGEDFWSFEAIQLSGTNGPMDSLPPPMTCLSSPTKKTNPLLPDLQLTAQLQLVTQSLLGLKCNFHTKPIIRWQLPAAFLLSPLHLYLLWFSRVPLADANYQIPAQFVATQMLCFEVFIQFWFPSIFRSCRVQLHLHKKPSQL